MGWKAVPPVKHKGVLHVVFEGKQPTSFGEMSY